jgi:cytochrome c
MLRQAAFLAFISLGAALSPAAAEEIDGHMSFNNHCRTCHSIRPGDNRLGPSLFGIAGAVAGQVQGYRGYSGGLKGIRWDDATLDRFLANPTSISTSTNMIYPPIANAEERHKIIEYLKTLKSE